MANVTLKKGLNPGEKANNVLVYDLTQVAPNRKRKDIAHLQAAIERAESIHIPNDYALQDIYHDVVTIDGHLSGILQKRTDAITNKNIRFVDKDGSKVDAFDDLIDSDKFNRLLELIIESRFYGKSGVEFIVGKEFDFEEIPRKHIRMKSGEIVKSQYDPHGINVNSLPMVWTIGRKNDLGKLLQCSLYAIYKRGAFGDFAQYVEIFGQPVRIIYYDAYDTQTKNELRKILTESGSSLAMMIPMQAKFEMLDGKTSNGTGELQERLIDACNDEMSLAILGNTETSKSSKSSGYAQSETHQKQQLEITKSDIKLAAAMLNSAQFISILKSYGFPVEGGKFEFEKEQDLDELRTRLDIDREVSDKVPVSDDYWYETYGIPKPDNYDELKAKQEAYRMAIINSARSDDEPDDDDDNNKPGKKNDIGKKDKSKNLIDRVHDFFLPAPFLMKRGKKHKVLEF